MTSGSASVAEPTRWSSSRTAAKRSNICFSRSTSLIVPSARKWSSSTPSGKRVLKKPSSSRISSRSPRLRLDQPADLGVGEEGADLGLVVPLDDEVVVEFRGVADVDVLHAERLAQPGEDARAVDPEAEAVPAHEGGAHPGVGDVVVPGRDRVGVQGQRPVLHVGLDLVPLPEAPVDEIGPDLGAELAPDFFPARTKNSHGFSPPQDPFSDVFPIRAWIGLPGSDKSLQSYVRIFVPREIRRREWACDSVRGRECALTVTRPDTAGQRRRRKLGVTVCTGSWHYIQMPF